MDQGRHSDFGAAPENTDLSISNTVTDNVVIAVLGVVAGLSILSRIWSRHLNREGLWWDDYMVFASYFFLLANVAAGVVGGYYGAGKHIWILDMPSFKCIIKVLYGYTMIYGGGSATIKLSFIFSYIRIFHVGKPKTVLKCRDSLSINIIIGGILSAGYALTLWFADLGICRPIHHLWDQYTDPGAGKCDNVNLYFILMGAANMIIDIYILAIPIIPISKLQMPLSKRLFLIGMFSLGSFVCIASAMRIYYLHIFSKSPDISWNVGPVFVWSAIEPSIAILSSCLMASKTAFSRLWRLISGRDPRERTRTHTTQRSNFSRISSSCSKSKSFPARQNDEIALFAIDEEQRIGSGTDHRKTGVQVTKEFDMTSETDA